MGSLAASLFTINLTNGTPTLIGQIGPGPQTINGLTVAPQAQTVAAIPALDWRGLMMLLTALAAAGIWLVRRS